MFTLTPRKTVLFFLVDGAMTQEAQETARQIEVNHAVTVKFRNGTVQNTGAPEKADFVSGSPVPFEYQSYPFITPDGVTNAPAPAATAADASQPETNAGQAPAQDDLAAQIGSTGGGWN